jgi:DNA mismatch repair protein MutS
MQLTSNSICTFGEYSVEQLSPMMLQWHELKLQVPDALLLFRLGDFYEAFYNDAIALANECNVTLTKRQESPMAGVPQHMLETYLDKLIQKGLKVAIAEQQEDSRLHKGLVGRKIVRIESPATYSGFIEQKMKRKNYFAAIVQLKNLYGIAFIDLSTQSCVVFEADSTEGLLNILIQNSPKEILIEGRFEEKYETLLEELRRNFSFRLTCARAHYFHHETAVNFLLQHFKIHQLDGLGLQGKVPVINALGALLSYLKDQQHQISSIKALQIETTSNFLVVDHRTNRHLNISQSLLPFLDTTITAMGGRLFKEYLENPLLDLSTIRLRQQMTADVLSRTSTILQMQYILQQVHDLERLLYRISVGLYGVKELLMIHSSLKALLNLPFIFENFKGTQFFSLKQELSDFQSLFRLLDGQLQTETCDDKRVFRQGVFPEIDTLRDFISKGDQWLIDYQEELRKTLDIRTLKVSYTRAFGYYIEVSRAQSDKVPSDFVRRQTLVQQERFINQKLQEFEEKSLSAEENLKKLEEAALRQIGLQVIQKSCDIKALCHVIAKIDVILSFVKIAQNEGYIRPEVKVHGALEIQEGRHPVVEKLMGYKTFIPNSIVLNEERRLGIITGPNMGGKSTYIRQVALIILMAQMGMFVPAKKACIPIFDRIFSRIGAQDDLFRGQSTFMVEMAETAEILNNLTDRSFVILDEIGRGTGTYDGISIAWSVLEYLAKSVKKPKTLFATHYTELTDCQEAVEGVFNLKAVVKEHACGIDFSYQIVNGASDKSYGIHVAKLAGLPTSVVQRSTEILKNLEKQRSIKTGQKGLSQNEQIVIF